MSATRCSRGYMIGTSLCAMALASPKQLRSSVRTPKVQHLPTPKVRSGRYAGRKKCIVAGHCSHSVHAANCSGWSSMQIDADGKWTSTDGQLPTDLDAIVVLAGGQIKGGSGLPQNVEPRLDAAMALHGAQGLKSQILCTGGGTPHKPPILDENGHVYFESNNMADYMMNKGFPASSILKEVSSFDTIGNGYFSLTIHSIPRGWHRIAVITSEFHMPRSKAIFEHCYGLAGDDLGIRFNLHFMAVPDIGMPDDVLEARREREANSLQNFLLTVKHTPTLSQFSEWMHMEHMCYSVPRQAEFGKRTISDDKALASY